MASEMLRLRTSFIDNPLIWISKILEVKRFPLQLSHTVLISLIKSSLTRISPSPLHVGHCSVFDRKEKSAAFNPDSLLEQNMTCS